MGDLTQGCRGKAAIWAAALGVVVAIFLMVVAHEPFYVAFFLGLLTFVLFGAFLIWAFCSDEAESAAEAGSGAAPGSAGSANRAETVDDLDAPVSSFQARSPEGAAARNQAEAAQPTVPQTDAASAPDVEPAAPAATPEPAAQPAPEPAAQPEAEAKPEPAEAEAKPAAPKPAEVKAEAKEEAAAPAASGQPVAAEGEGKKPRGLKAPRKAGADDLTKIEGIGPKLQEVLNGWGVYHYDQIAKWGPEEVAYADQNVPRFKGRCTRDKWVSQANIIVAEGMDAFLERAKTNDY